MLKHLTNVTALQTLQATDVKFVFVRTNVTTVELVFLLLRLVSVLLVTLVTRVSNVSIFCVKTVVCVSTEPKDWSVSVPSITMESSANILNATITVIMVFVVLQSQVLNVNATQDTQERLVILASVRTVELVFPFQKQTFASVLFLMEVASVTLLLMMVTSVHHSLRNVQPTSV
uniref:Transmembrane protein n=1 Tax=Cacopsylla melanoneura TaxID=428564 RepID=A0A8D8V1Q4_9HEMI